MRNKMKRFKTPIWAVFFREAERIKHNPAYRFMLFTGPMVGILIIFFIFKQGTVKELPIAVVDQDDSSLSIKIENNLNASPDVAVVMHMRDMFQAREMVENGSIEAIVLIPAETEKSIFKGLEVPVPVYINGSNVLKAGIIQRSIVTTLKTVSGSIQLKKLMIAGKNEKDAMSRIVPVKINKHILFNPYTNYTYFLSSALLYLMLYLFVFLSSIYTLGNELKRGTGTELLQTSNNSVRLAIIGKMAPYTIIFCGFAMLINLLLFEVEKMPVNGDFLFIFLGQFVTIITYQLMGLIFIGATTNLRLALSLGSAYSMMSITFSGLTFPLEAMPKIAQCFSAIFPFTWWEKLVISQSLRGAPLRNALPYICYILVFQLLSLFFLELYKHHLSNPKYWGKS
jgi:ABC-2 type transport system permease protein